MAWASPQASAQAADPLPSWNDGPTKNSIIDFVARVTKEGGPDYVKPAERIATFDNDGTLWIEQPIYNQFAFAMDEVKAQASKHPDWSTKEPFKSVIAGDMKAVAAMGEKGMLEIVAATHSGMTTVDFNKTVAGWLETAKHPRFKVLYTDLVYQPMLELLAYLRANDFKTFIVSGGGVEFMRVFADKTYGVPPEQVIGSSGVTQYQTFDEAPVLVKLPKVLFVDDGPGKPEGINHFIGRQPIFAFGNSDGDKEMLEWTAYCKGACFMGLVHHTDAEREYAYDRDSSVGKLDKALDEAIAKGWTVVDMKNDWKTIFPAPPPAETDWSNCHGRSDQTASAKSNEGPGDADAMVFVQGGTFRMGSDKHYPEEAPAHNVTVSGFFIDPTPVTNAQFRKFVEATGHVTFAEIAPDRERLSRRAAAYAEGGLARLRSAGGSRRSTQLEPMVDVQVRRQLAKTLWARQLDQGPRRPPRGACRLHRCRSLRQMGGQGIADRSRMGICRARRSRRRRIRLGR